MSLLKDVTQNTIKLIGENLVVTEGVEGENLFIEVKGTLKLTTRVNIVNRAIIIGNYLDIDTPLLSARKVDFFKDVNDMLLKTQQYISGVVAGKTVDDSLEILTRYIYLSGENLIEPVKALSNLFEEGNVTPSLFDKIFFAIDFALRKDSRNPVLKTYVEKLFSSLISQLGKGDIRASELMKVAQKISQENYQDTPFWNQDYALIMSGIVNRVLAAEGMTVQSALKAAEEDFNRSSRDVQKKSTVAVLYLAQAMQFYNSKQFQKAIEFGEKALKIDPENQGAKNWIARSLNELSAQYLIAKNADKYKDVIAAQEKAIQLNPNFGHAYHNLAVALWLSTVDQPDLERIISLFEKSLTINPDDPMTKSELVKAYDALAALYMQGKRPEKSDIDAAALLEKALILCPESDGVKSGLSASCMLFAFKCEQKQIPGKTALEGEPYLKRAIEFKEYLSEALNVSLAIACNQYAVAYDRGDIPDRSHIDSIHLLELAIKLNPSFEQAKTSLYNLYTQYIEKCLAEVRDRNSPFHFEEAVRCLKRAIVLNPDDQECKETLQLLSEQMISGFKMIVDEAESEGRSTESVIKEMVQSRFSYIGILYIETDTLLQNLEKNIISFESKLEASKGDQKLKSILVSLYNFLATLYSIQELPDKNCLDVLNLLEKANFLDPNEPGIKASLGKNLAFTALLCYEDQVPGKNIEDGLKYLERAIPLQSSLNENGRSHLAAACNCYAVSTNAGLLPGKGIDYAIFLLNLAIDLDQNKAMPYFNLGSIYLSQNQDLETSERVMTLFEMSYSLDPGNELVRKNLVQIYEILASHYSDLNNRRSFDTLSVLEKALSLDPDNLTIKFGLGCSYLTIAGEYMSRKYPGRPLSEGMVLFDEYLKYDEYLTDVILRQAIGKLSNNYAVACINKDVEGRSMDYIVFLLKTAILNDNTLIEAHGNLLKIYRDFLGTKPIIANVFPEYFSILSSLPDSIENPEGWLMSRSMVLEKN